MIFSALFLGVYLLLFDRRKLRISLKDFWIFACSGILCLAGFNCCYFYTVTSGYAAIGGVLLYTSPAFILFFARLFFNEKITFQKIIALLLMLSGCLLISGALFTGQAVPAMIFVAGIGSGLLYGLYSIFGKIALRKYDAATIVFYTFLTGSLCDLYFCTTPELMRAVIRQPSNLIWLSGCALICSVLPYILYTWGLKHTTAGRASILVAVEPLVCTLLGFGVYGEDFSLSKLAGISAVIAAIIILSLPQKTELISE